MPAGGPAAAVAPLAALTLVGHGWGSGAGMGQWGAFGYAVRYHFGYGRILNHFYGGTRPTTLAALHENPDPVISVVLLENLDLVTNVGYDPVVTSSSEYTVTGQALSPGPPATPAQVAAGAPPTTTTTTSPSTTTLVPSSTSTSTAPTTAPSSPSGAQGTTSSSTTAPAPATRAPVPTASSTTAPGTTAPTTTTTTTTTTTPTTTTAANTAPTAINTHRYVIRPGRAVDLRLAPDGTWNLYVASSCAQASAAAAGGHPLATGLVDPLVTPASTSPSAPMGKLLTVCRHDGVDQRLRGRVEAYDREGYERTLNLVPLEGYVAGVVPGEVSASWGSDGATADAPQGQPWGFQALEAQAVAARSYVLARAASGGWNGYADICDSLYCQTYVGASYETPVSDLAAEDTAGVIRVAPGGHVVETTYSASTGGYSAPVDFPAVPDLGDACVAPGVPLECNPVHTWSVTLSGATLAHAFPSAGKVLAVHVARRNRRGAFGGRATRVVVTGTRQRLVVSGTTFAVALGLRSNWFALAAQRRVGAPPTTTAPPTTVPPTTVPTTTTLPPPPTTTSSTLPPQTTTSSTTGTAAPPTTTSTPPS